MDWRKASYSVENGNCVEAASNGSILVRDPQNRDSAVLGIPAGAWRAFTARLKVDIPVS
jgi:Domain of unknown function (DUF397)